MEVTSSLTSLMRYFTYNFNVTHVSWVTIHFPLLADMTMFLPTMFVWGPSMLNPRSPKDTSMSLLPRTCPAKPVMGPGPVL